MGLFSSEQLADSGELHYIRTQDFMHLGLVSFL
jgi:hypothetical protein